MTTAPSTANYTVGKGIVKFDRFDANGLPTGLRNLGNAPEFNLNVEIETLEHYSSQEGTKTLDLEPTLIRRLKGSFTLDEYDKENLRAYLMGVMGTFAIRPIGVSEIQGELDFKSTNEVGQKYHIQIWKAKLKPAGELNFIGEDWGMIEFEFTAQKDAANHPNEPYCLITPLDVS